MAIIKPMLGNNQSFDLEECELPIAASIKRDGIRGESVNKSLLSRELKPIPNKQVQQLFQTIPHLDTMLDMELYIHGLPFNEHSTFIMTHDLATRKHSDKIKASLRKQELTNNYYYYLNLPKDFKFYIFDVVMDLGYCDRIDWLKANLPEGNKYEIVDYKLCYTIEEIEEYYDYAIEQGYEGLVLRKPNGAYKHGRATRKEQTFLKLKPIKELTATCTGFTERMINTNISFKNELGFSTKRNTVDNKEATGIAATVITDFNGDELKITLTGTEEERMHIWNNQQDYLGRDVLFEGMLYGSKNLPRHPVFLKFITQQ